MNELILFYATALSYPKHIREDLDILYKKNRFKFYEYAIKSPFYNCLMAKESALLREEYFRKTLGILEYFASNTEDEEIENEIIKLFQKGYKKVYKFFSGKDQVDMNEFYLDCIGEIVESTDDDEIVNGSMTAGLFFSAGCSKVINMERIIEIYNMKYQYYIKADTLFPLNKKYENQIRELKKKLPKNIWQFIFSTQPEYLTPYNDVYNTEPICSWDLFNELGEINRTQYLNEVLQAYIIAPEVYNFHGKFDLLTYVIGAIHIRLLCKAYCKVKEIYFENNREIQYIELQEMQNKLTETLSKLGKANQKIEELTKKKSSELEELRKENEELKKKLKKTQSENEQIRNDSKELQALREFIYTQEEEKEEFFEVPELNLKAIAERKVIVIGGHPRWQNQLKNELPDWKYISAESSNFDLHILDTCTDVIINTSYLSHVMYQKIINVIRNRSDIRLLYANSSINISLLLQALER